MVRKGEPLTIGRLPQTFALNLSRFFSRHARNLARELHGEATMLRRQTVDLLSRLLLCFDRYWNE
jgi:hypothetical protein